MVWFRVRISESQRDTPTQKYTESSLRPRSKWGATPIKIRECREKEALIFLHRNIIPTCAAHPLLPKILTSETDLKCMFWAYDSRLSRLQTAMNWTMNRHIKKAANNIQFIQHPFITFNFKIKRNKRMLNELNETKLNMLSMHENIKEQRILFE